MPSAVASVVEPALRASADPLASDLLSRLRRDPTELRGVRTTRPFPRTEALRIYRHKAAKGDKPAVRTEGYSVLLAALAEAVESEVIVHGVTFTGAVYLVFTDPARIHCLGVLRKTLLDRGG